MDKMRMESVDITDQNIDKIANLFPSCITEAKDENGKLKKAINFDMLRQLLSKDVAEGDEAYEFTWVGKKNAIIEANTPIRKTLRPCKEESVNWDTTENLYIEGDNLEVLKLLQESYLGKVKMIYIDPPYNTGNDFIYNDDFKSTSEEYTEDSGAVDENGNRMFKNTDSNGRFHSDWCSMIYPRLSLARNLLADDGVILISIDDNEQANLKVICDEIFGNSNFIGCIARLAKRGGNKGDLMKPKKDYILTYGKNVSSINKEEFGRERNLEINDWKEEVFNGISRKFVKGDIPFRSKLEVRPNQRYYIECPDGSLIIPPGDVFPEIKKDGEMVKPVSQNDKCWTWSAQRYLEEKSKGRFLFTRSEKSPFLNENGDRAKWSIYKKIFEEEIISDNNKEVLSDFLDSYQNILGTKEVDSLGVLFSYPKPSELIKYLISIASSEDSIILDFFSGSATTAHAVMQFNAEDGGNRKYIMVQLPEACDEKSEAFKAGYKNICEIGKERIRRAAKKIHEEHPDAKFDDGFRVLKVADSNMTDVYYSVDDYSQNMLTQLESNIKPDRTDMDLLFGCLLEWGLPLSMPYTSEKIESCTVHTYNDGDLIACFDESIPDEVIKEIAKRQPLRAVFRDSSFKNSPSKINVSEIFKMLSPDTSVKVI